MHFRTPCLRNVRNIISKYLKFSFKMILAKTYLHHSWMWYLLALAVQAFRICNLELHSHSARLNSHNWQMRRGWGGGKRADPPPLYYKPLEKRKRCSEKIDFHFTILFFFFLILFCRRKYLFRIWIWTLGSGKSVDFEAVAIALPCMHNMYH